MCSEWDIGHVGEQLSVENEVVLDVLRFLNHPKFDINIGPIGKTYCVIDIND